MSLYSLRKLGPGLYRIVRFDNDLEVQKTYQLARAGPLSRLTCSCPGYAKSRELTCKHIRLYNIFAGANRIDTGWFYSDDTNDWEYPVTFPKGLRRKR